MHDAAAHGLSAVVVHPSGGPYDDGRNHLVQMVRDFIEGKLPACVKGGYDLMDVRDMLCFLAFRLKKQKTNLDTIPVVSKLQFEIHIVVNGALQKTLQT